MLDGPKTFGNDFHGVVGAQIVVAHAGKEVGKQYQTKCKLKIQADDKTIGEASVNFCEGLLFYDSDNATNEKPDGNNQKCCTDKCVKQFDDGENSGNAVGKNHLVYCFIVQIDVFTGKILNNNAQVTNNK